MTTVHPPRHIVWSTDTIDLRDPFQKRWLLRQILMHGNAEDICMLELADIRKELNHLDLPRDIENLWRRYLEYSDARSKSD
jgi:hypothetical protein